MAAERLPLDGPVENAFHKRPLLSERRLPTSNLAEVYVPPDKIAEFIAEHPYMEYRELENGTRIFGLARQYPDVVGAAFSFTFANGGAWKSDTESQLSHYVEHIAALNIKDHAIANFSTYNASTSSREMSFDITGIANPSDRRIGVWDML